MSCACCYKIVLAECPDAITLQGGLQANTSYYYLITDKFGNNYGKAVTSDESGYITIDQSDFPTGLFMHFSGQFELKVYPNEAAFLEADTEIELVLCEQNYSCVIIEFSEDDETYGTVIPDCEQVQTPIANDELPSVTPQSFCDAVRQCVDVIQGPQGVPGEDGREVEFQKSATHIQWRYVGDVAWTNLVALTDITGPQGATGATGATGNGIASITLISTVGLVKTYRITYTSGGTYDFSVSDGAAGPTGPQGPKGDTGDTGPQGPNAVSNTTDSNINAPLAGNGSKVVALTAAIWGAFINALTPKTTPADADGVVLMDGADSNNAKVLSWANIKATLKTYFDSKYYAANARITIPSNLTTTSSSAADMTGIVTPTLDANSTYYFRGVFSVLSQSGGVKFAMTVPSGATGFVFATGRTTFTGAAQAAFGESGALSSTALATYANSGTDAIITGNITTSSTPGVVQFRWASGVGGQLSTVVAERTYLEIIKKP